MSNNDKQPKISSATSPTLASQAMRRIAMQVQYVGKDYFGWQVQADALPTVQACVEAAISHVANHPVTVTCAGRTDKGVHALGQIIHFDTSADRTPHAWTFGTNTNLPNDIRVLWAKEVPEDFHARYSANSRRYHYYLNNSPIRPAIAHEYFAWEYRPLDLTWMKKAAQCLLGEHDFSSFRGADCQAKHPVRTLELLDISQQGDLICFDLKANAFLHHMVRNIVGSLLDVGSGRKTPAWLQNVLHARDRSQAGMMAPAQGLYLLSVDYPGLYCLPRFEVKCPWIFEKK